MTKEQQIEKMANEITRLNNVQAELQELNIKYDNLRRDLADFDEFARQISKTRINLTGEAVPTCKTLLKYIKTEKSKAIKEFAELIKDYINNKVMEDFDDSESVEYYTIDLDEFESKIEELLKEYEK